MLPLILLIAAPAVAFAAGQVALPLEFEANAGQFAPEVLYLARTSTHFVYLTRDGVTLGLTGDSAPGSALRVTLAGANLRARIAAEAQAAGVSNYLVGNDASQWRRGVPHFGRVRYTGAWRGIDLVFHGRDQALEYDFEVSPGADPAAIRLRYQNARSLRLDRDGSMILATAGGEVRQQRPEIYQTVAGQRRNLQGGYRIVNGREVAFHIPTYDPQLPLVIDPVLTYSTYLGGTGTAKLNAMTLDSSGNIYLTGRVSSPDFPFSPAAPAASGIGLYRSQDRGASWGLAGTGVGPSKVLALAADLNNNTVAYAATSRGLYKTTDGGVNWKVAPGLPTDVVNYVSIDPSNSTKVYACMSEGLYQSTDSGATWKSILAGPVLSVVSAATRPGLMFAGRALAPILRSFDGGATWLEVSAPVTASVLAIDPTNSMLVYAGTARTGFYLSTDGGNNWAFSNTGMATGALPFTVNAIAIDPRISQRIYAATSSGLFRSSDGGAGWTPAGSGVGTRNMLSLAINPVDANFVYAGAAGGGIFRSADGGDTWASAGGGNLDVNALAADISGQFVHAGLFVGTQAFVTKINPGGTGLVYSTYVGGSGTTDGRAITVDAAGHTFVCGSTDAPDFPVSNAYQSSLGGSRDAFFLRLNASGSSLDYATFFGGHGDDVCENIAVDSKGNLYLAGNTFSRSTSASTNDFPTTVGVVQYSSPGGQDCFVSKFDDSGHRLTWSTYFGGSSTDNCTGLAVDNTGSAYVAGTTTSPNIPLIQPSLGGVIPSPPVLRYSSGFIARFNADATDLSYSALLGGLGGDSEIDGLALDYLGRVHVTGSSRAPDFPLSGNALARVINNQTKSIIAVVDLSNNRLVYSTILPGNGNDSGWRVQPDGFGNAWVTGAASASAFVSTPDAISHPAAPVTTPYVVHVDVANSKLLHATLLGGNAGGSAGPLAVAQDGTVFAAGATLSTDFTVKGGPFQSGKTADYAMFVQHLDFSQGPPPPPAGSAPVIAAVVNGASFLPGALSPGEAITITGTNLSTGATSVSIGGQQAPLFYVSATQINAQLPVELGPGTTAVKVTSNGVASTPFSVTVAPASPGIFLVGSNRAAAVNPDGSVNASGNPASPGDTLTVYFTGIGTLDNAVPTGQPAPLSGPLSRATLPVTVTIGGQHADAVFVGLTPGSIALAQANVVIPNLGSGDYPIFITIGGAASNGPLVSVASK
jgi:uncharacterized protein (TIGR03437 family)